MNRNPARSTARASVAALLLAFTAGACNDATITKPPVTAVSLTPSSATIPVGGTLALTAQVTNDAGQRVDTMQVFWSTSDSTIAVVNEGGVVSARRSGQVRIAATALGVSATAALVVSAAPAPPTTPPATPPVTPPAVATVSVSFPSGTFVVGQTRQAIVTLRSAAGAPITGRAVTWTTSNNNVATVSPTGVVRANKQGEATITATSEGKRGTAVVVVRKD